MTPATATVETHYSGVSVLGVGLEKNGDCPAWTAPGCLRIDRLVPCDKSGTKKARSISFISVMALWKSVLILLKTGQNLDCTGFSNILKSGQIRTHNPKVRGSNPLPATNNNKGLRQIVS